MIVIKTRQPDPELEQKIRMLLEREHIEAEQISIDSWEKLVLPGLTLDGMTHEVSCKGRKVSLTRLEFDLLLMLASHEGQIFSKEELFRAVWGQNCDDTLKVVANTVSNLRKKLAGCGSFIRTTHGGYTFARQDYPSNLKSHQPPPVHGKSEIRSILLHGRSWQNMASTATARPPGR